MKSLNRPKLIVLLFFVLGAIITPVSHVRAATAAEMNQKASRVLHNLYARSPAARHVGEHARAVLVFPEILKAGFIVGAQAAIPMKVLVAPPTAMESSRFTLRA